MAFGFEEILIVGPGGHVEDEISPPMLAAEPDPGLRAHCMAVLEGAVQIAGEPSVDLPDGGVQGSGSAAFRPPAELRYRRGRQDAAAATRVEDPERLGRLAHLEHGGHEASDADRGEELPQIRTVSRVGHRPFREIGPFEIEALQEVRCGDDRSAIPARSESVTCIHHRPYRIPDTFTHPDDLTSWGSLDATASIGTAAMPSNLPDGPRRLVAMIPRSVEVSGSR